MATDAFVDALADRELRKQVLQRSPASLAKALTWAIRIEAIDASGNMDFSMDHNKEKDKERDRDRRKERAYAHLATGESVGTEPASTEMR